MFFTLGREWPPAVFRGKEGYNYQESDHTLIFFGELIYYCRQQLKFFRNS